MDQRTFLVLGGTGRTGRHFVRLALDEGHRVRALVRDPAKLALPHPGLERVSGSITENPDLDALLAGTDHVVAMLGNAAMQREHAINTAFVRALVPAMRRHGVSRFLYQAGGLSAPPGKKLPPSLRLVRATLARRNVGQHEDNETVMRYLTDEAGDIEWMVHRAAIRGEGPSRGVLHRSGTDSSLATFTDCAAYNLRTVMDATAVHTCDLSTYRAR
ncbi:NAD(P)-dependent oxidoreductase [Streptomyces sp. NPDC058417]|uniref:NAD(P)-dependent oxidoreductase n=1 Tax=unclassified Streptomyces TaxID=2593676 RepID=UPI00364C1325